MNEKNTGNDTIYLRKVNLIKFLPSTHSFSTLVSNMALFSEKVNTDRTIIPTNRNIPLFFWIFEPHRNSVLWIFDRNHSAGLLPLALPCK